MIREAELPPVFHGISTISQAITGKISPKPLISVQVDCFEYFTKTGGEGGSSG
jgi:hypothetical protein